MLFRTELNIPPSRQKIYHKDLILLIGSCFSQNIAVELLKCKFNCISNPFGTIYNPVSIARVLHMACTNAHVREDEFLLSQGVYVHTDFHSTLGDQDKKLAVSKVNQAITEVYTSLPTLRYLFITPGTMIAYLLVSTGRVVANCHKLPGSMFQKSDITTEAAFTAMTEVIEMLHAINPSLNIVLTVSPVRHIKDGIIENSRSKARLIQLTDMLVQKFGFVSYFPAYEWVMDDLRDYRFYGDDLIHPNEMAISYIWEKFKDHYFDTDTMDLIDAIAKINRGMDHRPFNDKSEEYKKFLNDLEEQKKRLKLRCPWIDMNRK